MPGLFGDDDLFEDFFVKVVHFDYRENPGIIRKIVTSEKMLKDFKEEENMMVSTKHRDRDYVDDLKRWKLRKQIINELFTLNRPGNEEEITQGAGYLADLAVSPEYQQFGIGKQLLAITKQRVGEESMILLLSVPDAMEYYPKVGFSKEDRGFIMHRTKQYYVLLSQISSLFPTPTIHIHHIPT